MKRLSRVLIASLFLLRATVAVAGELTAEERDALLAHLDRTNTAFLKSVEGLSEAQWNYRAAEGRWTVAEIAEHIAASEKMIRDMTVAAMKEPATAELLKDARKDQTILAAIPDRTQKFKAPEPLQPQNRFGSPAAALEAFRSERADTVKLARDGGDLRAYAARSPLGNLDAYGFLLFLSSHAERHTKQIEEVKADPGFPKN